MGKDLKGKELGVGFRQRKDGRYEARALVNGVRVDLIDSSISRLKKNFEKERARVLRDKKNARPDLTLREWYDEWFEKFKAPSLKNDVCRKSYDRKTRNTYIEIIGEIKVEELSQMNIQEATNELFSRKKYAPKGVREAMSILSKCLDMAVVNHIIPTNPCVGINIPLGDEPAKERRVLDHWEQDLFLEEAENSYYKEAYKILLLTGMRIGEFSGLQWQDIDFENRVIRISRSMTTAYMNGQKILELTSPKTTNSYRRIPFFGDVDIQLKAWREKQQLYKKKLGDRWRTKTEFGDLVFTTTLGSPVTRYNIVHDIAKLENNIRLKEEDAARKEGRAPRYFAHLHPHAFRHTFATRCFEKGLDPLVVQSIMGHSSYSTTISYTHILDKKINEAVERAGKLID